MSYKPILLNTEMVQAILEGRKTQTRRIAFSGTDLRNFPCASYPNGWWYKGRVYKSFESFIRDPQTPKCMYRPGDILWVRETFDHAPCSPGGHFRPGNWYYYYKADGDIRPDSWKGNWHPSIHMPKEAARIFLRVTDVQVEWLHEMDEEAAIAEGFEDSPAGTDSPLERFTTLWDKTVKREDLREYGYHANPLVWVITFELCDRPEGWPDV